MSSRQEADLCGERTDLIHAAAVDALVILEQPAADDLLLNFVDELGVNDLEVGVFLAEGRHDGVLNREHTLVADVLVVGVERVHDVLLAEREDLVEHIVVKLARLIGELGLADLGDD